MFVTRKSNSFPYSKRHLYVMAITIFLYNIITNMNFIHNGTDFSFKKITFLSLTNYTLANYIKLF